MFDAKRIPNSITHLVGSKWPATPLQKPTKAAAPSCVPVTKIHTRKMSHARSGPLLTQNRSLQPTEVFTPGFLTQTSDHETPLKNGFCSRYRENGADSGCYEISREGEPCLWVDVQKDKTGKATVEAITGASGADPMVEDLQELEAAGVLSPAFMLELGLARPVPALVVDFSRWGGAADVRLLP